VAIVGININQDMGPSTAVGSIVPTLDGLNISITNNAGGQLRVQIQGPNGATDATQRWCAPIPGNGGFIPWTAFNTACWDNSGTYYAMQPIVAVLVLVPGSTTGPTVFDFCVNTIGPATDPGSSGSTGCSITGSPGTGGGTITDRFGTFLVTRDSRNYVVQNNVWGNAASNQSMSVSGVSFTINQQNASNSTSAGPVSYPSVFIGNNNGHATTGSNLPKQVSTLTTVPTGWDTNAGSVSGTYNAAYDVWFNNSNSTGTNAPTGGYLMVWLYDPSNAQPIGSLRQSGVSISGSNWDVWIGTQNGRPVISYVRVPATASLTFDLNVFIEEAVARGGTIQNGWYLTNIFAGFEIWNGGASLRTNNFCAVVN
jgi:hypothetical protein